MPQYAGGNIEPPSDGGPAALLNLSVLMTLAQHCDPASSFSCLHVCRAWKEAFSLARVASNLNALVPLDRVRSAFAASLHGSVCLQVPVVSRAAQIGVEAHLRALARNKHINQLQIHLPVREPNEPQMRFTALSQLAALTQLSTLIVAPPPNLARAQHTLTEEDAAALQSLRSLTFLELCLAVPPSVGLGGLAQLAAAGHMTALRLMAFGHSSAPWQVSEVAQLCDTLACVSTLTDLRLRCVSPPTDRAALPALMALDLPKRLLNFALTFVGHTGGSGSVWEEGDEEWMDQLAPRPGLHVLITERGCKVTRLDINIEVDVPATELPDVDPADADWDPDADPLSLEGSPSDEDEEQEQQAGRGGEGAQQGASSSGTRKAPAPASPAAAATAEQPRLGPSSSEEAPVPAGAGAPPASHHVPSAMAASSPSPTTGRAPPSFSASLPPDRAAQPSPQPGLLAAACFPSTSTSPSTTAVGGPTPAAAAAAEEDPAAPGSPAASFTSAKSVVSDPAPGSGVSFDMTSRVLAEYRRLLHEELGLEGSLGDPQDLHLGIRVNILEGPEELEAPQAGGGGPPGAGAGAGPIAAGPGGAGGAGGGLGAGPHGGAGPVNMFQAALAMLHPAGLQHFLQHQPQGPPPIPEDLLPHIAAAVAAHAHAPPNAQHAGAGAGGIGGPHGPLAALAAAAGAWGPDSPRFAAQLQQPRGLSLQLGQLSPHMCFLEVALVPMVITEPVHDVDTPIRPVVLDVRGGGHTQLKGLQITGFVDQRCRPAVALPRGWLSHVPEGMPQLDYLAVYDALPATQRGLKALHGLSSLMQLELRPLYLRFTPEVLCPMALKSPWLPPKLTHMTLKKIKVPPTNWRNGKPWLRPSFPVLSHLWLFDCEIPDLLCVADAPLVEDLRLGGTTTMTPLREVVVAFPSTSTAILECAPGATSWWSAAQLRTLRHLHCLRSLQLDAVCLEPPQRAQAEAGDAAAAADGNVGGAGAGGAAPPQGLAGAGAAADTGAVAPQADGAAAPNGVSADDDGSDDEGAADGDDDGDGTGGVSAILAVLASLGQLCELTLICDTPECDFEPLGDDEEGNGNGAQALAGGGGGGFPHALAMLQQQAQQQNAVAAAGAGAAAPANGAAGGAAGGGGAKARSEAQAEACFDAFRMGMCLAALGALQGLWRLKIDLPPGSVWLDICEALRPALQAALPRTAVELDAP